MNNTFATSDAIIARDAEHYLHPVSDLSASGRDMTVFTRAKGAYVFDAAGRKFLDGIAGLWCVNIGHGRKDMAEAISKQIEELTFYSTFGKYTHPKVGELSEALAQRAPGSLNHVSLASSGSCANEIAITTAHHYFTRLGKPSKRAVITRARAYHGSSYLTSCITRTGGHKDWRPQVDFVHEIPCPLPYRRPDGMSVPEFCRHAVAELEEMIVRLGPDNVACFIAEPIMGAGGIIAPPPGYHRATLEVCRKYDVLYISDEVVTAFGRLGHMFASKERFGIEPDILTCAKGLTSGYVPLSATLFSDQIMDVISRPGSLFLNGFTYSGHPVACAAALKNIDILEREGICEQVRTTGPLFQRTMESLLDLELVGDVRGSDFMIGIELVRDRARKLNFADEINVSKRIAAHCFDAGLVVRAIWPELVLVSPTLILDDTQIATLGATLRSSISATMDDLTREKLWSN